MKFPKTSVCQIALVLFVIIATCVNAGHIRNTKKKDDTRTQVKETKTTTIKATSKFFPGGNRQSLPIIKGPAQGTMSRQEGRRSKPVKSRKLRTPRKKTGKSKNGSGSNKLCNPKHITVLMANIDTSGSRKMRFFWRAKKILAALSTLVKDVYLGVAAFGSSYTVGCAPTKDMKKFNEGLEKCRYHGSKTNCTLALEKAIQLVNDVKNVHTKHVMTITDNMCTDNPAKETLQRADGWNILRSVLLAGPLRKNKLCKHVSRQSLCYRLAYNVRALEVAKAIVPWICPQPGRKNKS